MMHAPSMNQARKRITGPASNCENTIPSGVRMDNVLIFMVRYDLNLEPFFLTLKETQLAGSVQRIRTQSLRCTESPARGIGIEMPPRTRPTPATRRLQISVLSNRQLFPAAVSAKECACPIR